MPPLPTALREAFLDALAVLAPTECSGCGSPDRALCARCRAALKPEIAGVAVPGVGTVWHALDYAGAARRVLVAIKDAGRTDAARALAVPLRAVIAAAGADCTGEPGCTGEPACTAEPELVTVPSGRAAFRRRGYRPVDLVLQRAGLRAARVLRNRRSIADQAGLGARARQANREASLKARGRLDGRRFLLIDDILTTGATLREAARAVSEAGGTVAGGAVIAYTRLTHTPVSILPESSGKYTGDL